MQNRKITAAKILFVSILLFGPISCKPEKDKEPDRKTDVVVNAPEQIVTVAQAKTMYEAYGNRRVGLIEKYENEQNPEKKFDVARYGYYDYQTIKDYMAYIEQEAKKANVEIASLRFYFSNYPDQKTFEDGREIKHPRQNSFFLIPTTKSVNNEDYAFYIREGSDGNNLPMLLTDDLNPKKDGGTGREGSGNLKSNASFIPMPMYYKDRSLILNEGDMVPPPYKPN